MVSSSAGSCQHVLCRLQPKAMVLFGYGLKALKLWAKVSLSLYKLVSQLLITGS